MANKLYEETHIQAIANAIREKKGSTETYKVSEMAAAVRALQTGSREEKQAKTVTPTTVEQVVLPDNGFTCLSQVTVKAIPYVENANSAGGTTVIIG